MQNKNHIIEAYINRAPYKYKTLMTTYISMIYLYTIIKLLYVCGWSNLTRLYKYIQLSIRGKMYNNIEYLYFMYK